MTEFWETAFTEKQLMWGFEPTASALFARDYLTRTGAKDVLIPGVGYGRNARPFLERAMSVTGIEISETAIALARSRLGLAIPIVHGSVTDMPFDRRQYDGVFCYGLLYLLDPREREKLIRDCYRHLAPGGHMIFTVISKRAPMYGQGTRLGDDWYERLPNLKMYFYDAESVKREFGPYGLLELSEIDEPAGDGASLPFINVVCRRDAVVVGAEEAVERLRAGHGEITISGALEPAHVEAIAEALASSKTTILRMGGCSVTDLGGEAIGNALRANSALRELWLFDNAIGDAGAEAIADALRSSASLTTLCLNENRVGEAGARAIGEALRSPTSLVELGLGRNRIGDAGAMAIGEALASNGTVVALSLNDNRIGDAGAMAIGDALRRNTSLKTLRLGDNAIGDAGAEAVRAARAASTTLKRLHFDGNPASLVVDAGVGTGAQGHRE